MQAINSIQQNRPSFQARLVRAEGGKAVFNKVMGENSNETYKTLGLSLKEHTKGLGGKFKLTPSEKEGHMNFTYVNNRGESFQPNPPEIKLADLKANIYNDGKEKPYSGAVRNLLAKATDAVGLTEAKYTDANKPLSFLRKMINHSDF